MSAGDHGRQRTQIRMAMAISSLMMAHQVAGKASRDAIFLSHFRITDLPAMVVAAAIAAVFASIVGSPLLVRCGPHRVASISFGVSSALQFAEWLLLGHSPRIAACVIYVHIAAFGAVLLSGFWSVMNESFESRSAKQVFGKIGGTGTLGGLCGGLLAERVAAWFGAADVVLLLAVVHLICAVLLWHTFPANTALVRDSRDHGAAGETSPVNVVQRYPFLLLLAGLVIAASSGTAMLDFVFKAQAAHTFGRGAALLRFFGLYYTATSLLTFLLQTFMTAVCMRYAGPAMTAGILPATISLVSLAGLVIPGFSFLSILRGLEVIMRGSLYRSGYEVFYTALRSADKRAIKSLIDVGADRAGDAAGAAGVSLMLVLSPGGYTGVLALASGISVIALWLASRLQRGYLHALEKSLRERAVELDPALVQDSVTRSVLMRSVAMPSPAMAVQARAATAAPQILARDLFLCRAADLRSGEASRAIRAADETGPDDWAVAPLLIDLLAWDEAMPAARRALERMGPKITGMLVDVLLDPVRDFVIRRRVPRLLAVMPARRSAEGLLEALGDQRFEVRFHAARALFVLVKDHPELTIVPDRLWAAVNCELSVQRSVWENHRVLDRRDAGDKKWFFDDELLDRSDHSLEHLFTLLALLLPEDSVRIAFRALHTDDRQLRGTAFEYLESATPTETRRLLLPVLEANTEKWLDSAMADGAVRSPLATREQPTSL